ncbi:hypothetical protein MLD38_011243 [Melastoma candidum]|uniref:Uncharacterized protein n=1 Tax=Melastoma candidum TaxID=119954 RepID=A0ACB9R2G2_9MYRT|nr:hypothetical protein MLD38_011243 [Melastoma candidum]
MAHRLSAKLSPRYFGPFPIIARIGVVAYKLQLPPEAKWASARIHTSGILPYCSNCGREHCPTTLKSLNLFMKEAGIRIDVVREDCPLWKYMRTEREGSSTGMMCHVLQFAKIQNMEKMQNMEEGRRRKEAEKT